VKSNLSLMLVLAVPVLAQSTIKDALTKHWKTSAEFTIAVADAMPAESYNFRPNLAEMSFGQLMAHIAGINEYACAIASGLPRPALPPKIAEWSKDTEKVDVSKETAMPFLKESFEFCNQAVTAMTPERLDTVVGPAARNLTGFEWLFAYFTHTAHHRAQAEVYFAGEGYQAAGLSVLGGPAPTQKILVVGIAANVTSSIMWARPRAIGTAAENSPGNAK
jgi:uncharacterized damage-inducible protein DinB